MKQIITSLPILLALSIGGCNQESSEAPAEAPSPTTPTATAPAEPAAEPTPTADQVPVAEDFEAEFKQSITAENLEAELARVEAEMAEEAP